LSKFSQYRRPVDLIYQPGCFLLKCILSLCREDHELVYREFLHVNNNQVRYFERLKFLNFFEYEKRFFEIVTRSALHCRCVESDPVNIVVGTALKRRNKQRKNEIACHKNYNVQMGP